MIELVVGIGVLAILATLAFAAINPVEQFKKAQDLRRKGDVAQLQRALEAYYQDYGRYPASSTNPPNKLAPGGTPIDWGSSWTPYIDVLPKDPTSSKNYSYWADSAGQTYRIYVSLDRALRDDKACHPNNGSACDIPVGNPQSCGGVCNFGATSSNISP